MRSGPRHIYWTPWVDPGLEQTTLTHSHDGAEALGLVLRMLDTTHLRCRYELQVDDHWRTRKLSFAVMGGVGQTAARLVLESDGAGNWRADATDRPDLAGCLDVDIQITPLTNTLPIRRLALKSGECADLRAVYLRLPELTLEPVEQCYTCLEPLGPGGGRYFYQGLFRDFSAELRVDADGLVMDYPDTFRRVWPK